MSASEPTSSLTRASQATAALGQVAEADRDVEHVGSGARRQGPGWPSVRRGWRHVVGDGRPQRHRRASPASRPRIVEHPDDSRSGALVAGVGQAPAGAIIFRVDGGCRSAGSAGVWGTSARERAEGSPTISQAGLCRADVRMTVVAEGAPAPQGWAPPRRNRNEWFAPRPPPPGRVKAKSLAGQEILRVVPSTRLTSGPRGLEVVELLGVDVGPGASP